MNTQHDGHDVWPLISQPGTKWCRDCQVNYTPITQLTTAQTRLLVHVRVHGTTYYSGVQKRSIDALEALGLVTVTVHQHYDVQRRRGYKSYGVTAVTLCSDSEPVD